MEFPEPWHPVGTNASWLERELVAEVGPSHPLKGRAMRAIAVRQGCDDVLFGSADNHGIVAVVHLTYANRPESDPQWPRTTIFDSIQDWTVRGMKVDHDEFLG